MAHGLVLLALAFTLVPSRATCPRLTIPAFGQPQDLNKQILERIKVAAPKVTYPAVLGLLIASEYPERQILVAESLDLSR